MDYLNQNIAINLKRIRQARGMSLDLVAEQTGVSKSMLGHIERGDANPTIGILGSIASGLRTGLDSLVRVPEDSVYPVDKSRLAPSKEEPGRYRVLTYFPYEKARNFELYVIEVQPGEAYVSGGHGENTKEYVLVNRGRLILEIEGESYQVNRGDALRFDSDNTHIYRNGGDEPLELVSVFSYRT